MLLIAPRAVEWIFQELVCLWFDYFSNPLIRLRPRPVVTRLGFGNAARRVN